MEYGCEAEIIHHETKGSNHLEIIGRRRFTPVHQPASSALQSSIDEQIHGKEGIIQISNH